MTRCFVRGLVDGLVFVAGVVVGVWLDDRSIERTRAVAARERGDVAVWQLLLVTALLLTVAVGMTALLLPTTP